MGVALGWVEANVSNGCRDVIGTGPRSLTGSNPVASTILMAPASDMVRTLASQAGEPGSSPDGATI